jgi:hypothetical protein
LSPKRLANRRAHLVELDPERPEQLGVAGRRLVEERFECGGHNIGVARQECGHGVGEHVAVSHEGEQEVLGTDVVVAEAAGLDQCGVEHGHRVLVATLEHGLLTSCGAGARDASCGPIDG